MGTAAAERLFAGQSGSAVDRTDIPFVTIDPTTVPNTDSRTDSSRTVSSLWRPGLSAGVVAAAATSTIAGIASALGVSFESAPGEAIPLAGFAQLTLFFTVVGVLIAQGIRSRGDHPRSTFTKTAVALTALSVVPDLTMSFDAASKLTLMLTHVVAASIVIPVLGHATWHLYRRAVESTGASSHETPEPAKKPRYAADFPASLFSRSDR